MGPDFMVIQVTVNMTSPELSYIKTYLRDKIDSYSIFYCIFPVALRFITRDPISASPYWWGDTSILDLLLARIK